MSNTVKINASLCCVIFSLFKLYLSYTVLINLNTLQESGCKGRRESYGAFNTESHIGSREAIKSLKKGGK